MTATTGATTAWRLDPSASTAVFRCRGIAGVPVRGTVPLVHGEVTTGHGGEVLALSGTADAAALDTANARRDRDLRSPRLLDVAGTPTWRYRATSVVAEDDGWRVEGVLTARTETPLALRVTRAEGTRDGSVRLRAVGRLDRRDAGVRAPRAMVWTRVDVELDVVLRPVG